MLLVSKLCIEKSVEAISKFYFRYEFLRMSTICSNVPITCLASCMDDTFLLAGQGTSIMVFNNQGNLKDRIQVFKASAVHGIIRADHSNNRWIVYGSKSYCKIGVCNSKLNVIAEEAQLSDWIIHSIVLQNNCFFLLAHNQIEVIDNNAMTNLITHAETGPCILYSGILVATQTLHPLIMAYNFLKSKGGADAPQPLLMTSCFAYYCIYL